MKQSYTCRKSTSCGWMPAIANAFGAAKLRPMRKRSGRFGMSSAGVGWPSAAPMTTTGFFRRSRARSRVVTMIAFAQSVSSEQS